LFASLVRKEGKTKQVGPQKHNLSLSLSKSSIFAIYFFPSSTIVPIIFKSFILIQNIIIFLFFSLCFENARELLENNKEESHWLVIFQP
jgi:hypothetical protein